MAVFLRPHVVLCLWVGRREAYEPAGSLFPVRQPVGSTHPQEHDMEAFNVRNDLGHDAALSEASCTLEQALALIDSLNDDTQETKHQNRLYAVEFMVEAA